VTGLLCRTRSGLGCRIALLGLLCLSGLSGLSSVAVAEAAQATPEQTERQLKKLKSDIGALEKRLRSTQGERQQLTKILRKTETEGGKLSRQIVENKQQINQQEQRIEASSIERSQLRQQRDLQLEALAVEVTAAYRTGQQDRLRLLLNQQQPEKVARMLRYHQYVSEARSRVVAEVEQTLSRLERVEQQLQEQQARLEAQQQQLRSGGEALRKSRRQRQQALLAVEKQEKSQSQLLQQFKTDQTRLKGVLEELQQALVLNELQVSTQAFAQRKGKLPWPTTDTRVALLFGRNNALGVRRDGMLIRAKMGDRVQAVHNGRVVFSDWMRGYGMLLILDHGDGYMSLYGHNQSLLKQVGDWVAAGIQVASAGDSGGQSQAGLYFAIRYQGEPINPKAWLKRN
jgi:septal ring factor EnvC (AmiA/AmiB activator)